MESKTDERCLCPKSNVCSRRILKYGYVRRKKFGRMLFISGRLRTSDPNILDVFDSFCGRKNARLGVNGNPECIIWYYGKKACLKENIKLHNMRRDNSSLSFIYYNTIDIVIKFEHFLILLSC